MYLSKKKIVTLVIVVLSVFTTALTLHFVVHAAAHSTSVAYVTDASSGVFMGLTGSNIFDKAVGSPGCTPVHTSPCTYTTSGGTVTTFTDISVGTVDTAGITALLPFDTVMLYQVCDIGSHSNFLAALNSYLSTGKGKVVIYDGDFCSSGNGGTPNYSSFLLPFATTNPGPRGATGMVTRVEPESSPATLTRGIAAAPPAYSVASTDAVGDSNTFSALAAGWCVAVEGTNALGTTGIQVGYADSTSSGGKIAAGGLVIYDGEDNAVTFGANTWDKTLFDNILDQPFNPDNLPCAVKAPPPTPSAPSSVVIDICSAPPPGVQIQAQPEKDFPCVTGNAGDEQGYAFGTTCFPTTANPCAFSSATKIAITIAFSNPNQNQADFELNVMINGVQVTSTNSACTGTADFTPPGTNRVCIDTSAIDFTGTLDPAIHPGHCTATATPPCIAPNPQGVFTIVSTDPSIVSTVTNGVNTLTLDFTSGQAIAILGIQAIIEF